MINIVMVDDHHLVRDGITRVLNNDPNFNVIGSFSSLKEMFLFFETKQPDLLLLDLRLEDGDGVSAAIQLKKQYPNIKVLLLSGYIEPLLADEAKRIGVEGYILKTISINRLIASIKNVIAGMNEYDVEVEKNDRPFCDTKNMHLLSSQENKIICMMSLGKTNKEIGAQIGITEKSVRNYANNMFKKLNVTNRTEAVAHYMRHQFLHKIGVK